LPLFERSGAGPGPVAAFDRDGLSPRALDLVLAEAAALLHQAFPAETAAAGSSARRPDPDELALAEAVAKLLEAVEVSRHAALHDSLTGLANRSLILDHLRQALARAERREELVAVVFIDLDDFKHINDTLGHVAGDELLVRVAERLRPAVRPSDTLGRWGGDEFVVVCEDLELVSDAPAIVARVAAAFEVPFDVAGSQLGVSASIGVAVSAGADQPATLIAAADSDMYEAKRDHPTHSRNGHRLPEALLGAGGATHRLLTRRLLEVLSTLNVEEEPIVSA
jgi:diguanylate cyclase (GGDEF)-like protein